jgi:hypothetical protein
VNQDLAGLGHSLRHDERSDGVERAGMLAPEAPDEERLVGAGAAIVLAAALGALFWALIYTLVF